MSRSEEEWKTYVAQKLRESDERLAVMKDQLAKMQEQLDKVTALDAAQSGAIGKLVENTAEILEVFASWKGAMKVLDYLGKVAKPLGYIVALGAGVMGLWAALRSGAPIK